MQHLIKKRLFGGGLWVLFGKLTAVICNLTVNACIARLIETNHVGVYFLIVSIVNFTGLFSLLGMDRSIVRIVSKSMALGKTDRAYKAILYALQIGFFSSCLFSILLYFGFGQFIARNVFNSLFMSDIMYYPAIWLILLTTQRIIAESFRGLHDLRHATLFNGVLTSFFSAIFLGVIFWRHTNSSLSVVLIIILCSYASNLLIALVVFKQKWPKASAFYFNRISRIELVKNSWFLHLINISYFILMNCHLWLIAYYVDKSSVALFGAVIRIVALITTTLSMIRLIILPTIGELYAQRKDREMESVLRTSATIACLPSIVALFFVVVFGKSLLVLIFGTYYQAGYPAIIILSIAHLTNVLTGHSGDLIVMASKEKHLFVISLLSVAIGFLISFLLIERIGVIGAALGAGTSIVIQSLLMFGLCIKYLSINTGIDLSKVSVLIKNVRSQAGEFIKSFNT